MANQYFQFKQFRVEQSLAAMKVCTEACIFGALAEFNNPARILDIGAGTGLLSLMLAQKFSCPIDAVEIEEQAFLQTQMNFEQTFWRDRLKVYHTSVQDYSKETSEKYDLIISNPPFFTDHLLANHPSKNLAVHNNSLSQEDLLDSIQVLLSPGGVLYLLLPPSEATKFSAKALKRSLFVNKRTILYNRPGSMPFRFISCYGMKEDQVIEEEMFIRKEDGGYSDNFIRFLKPYYLNF
jgi:tRNA1Val (adenine37-N6)-methyltransferase